MMSEFGTVPRRAIAYAALPSGLSAASNLVYWMHGSQIQSLDIALFFLILSMWLLAAYLIAMLAIGERRSLAGFLRFLSATTALVSPILLVFGAVLVLPKGWNSQVMIPVYVPLLLVGLALLTLLPAWPIFQANSAKLVSPIRVAQATKGHRWTLWAVTFASGSLGKLVPDIPASAGAATAILTSLGHFVVNTAILILAVSVAVTAWRFAREKDAVLAEAQ